MIITLGGRFGSGKTTVAKILAQRLGYERYSMGDFRKQIAKEKGMTIDQLNKLAERDPESDILADKKLQELAKTKDNLVIETRTGFHLIPNSFKVGIVANLEESAKRIMAKNSEIQPYSSLKEAMKKVKEGWDSDYRRYKSLYGVDYTKPSHFDLFINSTNLTPNEVADRILDAIKYKI